MELAVVLSGADQHLNFGFEGRVEQHPHESVCRSIFYRLLHPHEVLAGQMRFQQSLQNSTGLLQEALHLAESFMKGFLVDLKGFLEKKGERYEDIQGHN